MSQLVRFATASLIVLAAVVLAPAPASSDTAVLAPLPSVTAPALPALPLPSLPVPEVPVPDAPDVTDVPDVPAVSSPVSTPRLPAPSGPAPSLTGQGDQAQPLSQDGQAAGPSAPGNAAARRPITAAAAGSAAAGSAPAAVAALRPVIAQVDHAQAAAADRGVDDYLLGLVHDELCAALSALLDPMPETVTGLSPRVIAQLPPEVVNVVPQSVLQRATVRCASDEPSGAGNGAGGGDVDPLTRVLGLLPHSGMVGAAALPLGLVLLALGIGLRVQTAQA